MRKTLFILLALLAALSACRKNNPEEGQTVAYDASQLSFNFTVNYPSDTKAVRSGWRNGDKVFVFFSGQTGGYLSLDYDGSAWTTNTGQMGTVSFSTNTGTLTAIYLPYVNSASPTYSSNWTFPDANTDSYFLMAEKASYYITDTSNSVATLGAVLNMTVPEGYAQFFIPVTGGATATLKVACNAVQSAGLSAIASDGTVTEKASGSAGGWITAYADNIEGETGYYITGKPVSSPGRDCYFAIRTGASTPYTYQHFYKQRNAAIASHGAYQLLNLSDLPQVAADKYVSVAGFYWCTVNSGASNPWEGGTPSNASAQSPSNEAWTALLDVTKATWIPMTMAGCTGSLVVDATDASKYIFLPQADYWSANSSYYMHWDSEGKALSDTPPASAYIRPFKTYFGGGFEIPISGGDI